MGPRSLRVALGIAVLSALSGCAHAPNGLRVERLADDVELVRLSESIWVHVSEDPRERWGLVPANGLLVLGDDQSLLVDTGWNPVQTARILQFARDLDRPVRQLVVTHGHSDRSGGLRAISADVVVHAQELTVPALTVPNGVRVVPYVEEAHLQVGATSLEVFYPGAGHTKDNAVVYLPEARILFAGCIVRSAASPDLGNREEAVLAAWPLSLLKLLERYRDADLVIPGHGPPGGLNLIQHTLGLLEQELSIVTPN